MKILVVEDDFSSRKLMQKILEKYGAVDIAVDGEEALEAVCLAIKEKEPYDLICLDIMMPGMDGHEVLRAIRKIEEERHINGLDQVKVIMVTALHDPSNILQAFRSQCEDYIVKPVRKNTLIEKIRKLGFTMKKK